MYIEIINKIKEAITNLETEGQKIFEKVALGSFKADDFNSSASIFLDKSSHKRLSEARYRDDHSLDIICVFYKNKNSEDTNEKFIELTLKKIEIIQDFMRKNFILSSTDFLIEEESVACMIEINTEKDR